MTAHYTCMCEFSIACTDPLHTPSEMLRRWLCRLRPCLDCTLQG